MSEQADVRSIAALREWIARLVLYRGNIAESLSAARQEARRGEEWLEIQLQLWRKTVRSLEEELHEAKMRLRAKKTPGPTGREPDTTLEERDVRRVQARLAHAEDQVALCQTWIVKLPKMLDELFFAPSHRLESFLDADLARGEATIRKQVESLERYAELRSGLGGAR